MSADSPDLTALLVRMRGGDADAANQVMETLYHELHRMAASRMRREGRRLTLQPTALLHEAYLRFRNGPEVVNDRGHFFALAAQAMRRVLIDHARQRLAGKRGGGRERVTLEGLPGDELFTVDMLALDEALQTLATLDARACRIVELRFFGGLTDAEVCKVLDDNLSAVRRDWVFARSWLKARLEMEAPA